MPREHVAHRDQVFGMVPERGNARAFAGNHKWQRVDPESVHVQLQPRFDDPRDLGLNRRIAGVEIGLMIVEAAEIIFVGLFVEGPGSLLNARKSHTQLSIRRFLLRPDVPIEVFRVFVPPRLLEPEVIDRRVIDDEVRNNANAAISGRLREFHEVAERAVARVDVVVIGDVVTVIPARRRKEGL
jgi:hypothetical protein